MHKRFGKAHHLPLGLGAAILSAFPLCVIYACVGWATGVFVSEGVKSEPTTFGTFYLHVAPWCFLGIAFAIGWRVIVASIRYDARELQDAEQRENATRPAR